MYSLYTFIHYIWILDFFKNKFLKKRFTSQSLLTKKVQQCNARLMKEWYFKRYILRETGYRTTEIILKFPLFLIMPMCNSKILELHIGVKIGQMEISKKNSAILYPIFIHILEKTTNYCISFLNVFFQNLMRLVCQHIFWKNVWLIYISSIRNWIQRGQKW